MRRISSPLDEMKDHYEVVVVGSGYGGGIAASRLSRAGRKVCLLERGREMVPGDYPDTTVKAAAEMQVHTPEGHVGDAKGMFDFHVNKQQNVLVGCGLGGTSLINANVSLEPKPEVWDLDVWPQEIKDDRHTLLKDGFQRAHDMLKPNPYPDSAPKLRKTEAHQKSAEHLGIGTFYKTPINVTFNELEGGVNHVGVPQNPCTYCGDCVSGCNYGAKNTTLMNYLPDAWNHGTEIYCEASVKYLERTDDGKWLIHYQPVGAGRNKFDAPTQFVKADMVVLSAGTLGSTEILMRSAKKGLQVSNMLGEHFSGNGDILGFAYNNDEEINGVGFGNKPVGKIDPVGPCITSVIDMREGDKWDERMVLEEGSIPGAIGPILPGAMAAAAKIMGTDTDDGFIDNAKEQARKLDSLVRGPYHGAINNMQTYLIMSHDNGKGRMVLDDNDNTRIDWPGVGERPNVVIGNQRMLKATEALGGTYVPNPTWSKLLKHAIITVHPLGGCTMGKDASSGVVNHKCQVYADKSGNQVYGNLYVADGAVLPTSVAVNPLFTISAISERAMYLACKDNGWDLGYTLPSAPPKGVKSEQKLGIRFTETMRGFFSTSVHQDFGRNLDAYKAAAKKGKVENSSLDFTLTISGDDLDEMLKNPQHQGTIIGTVNAPSLSAEPLAVSEGVFNLFVESSEEPNTKYMKYRMKLTTQDGRHFYFNGFKSVHKDAGVLEIWPDTSTLYITVYEGENDKGAVVGAGVLHIKPADFAKQMTTMQVTGAKNAAERVAAVSRFGAYFAGSLWETYGGGFSH